MYQVPTYFYLNSYEHMYIKRRRNVYKLGIIHTTLIDLTWITYFEIFVSAKSDKKNYGLCSAKISFSTNRLLFFNAKYGIIEFRYIGIV